jgi:hypothetical protein
MDKLYRPLQNFPEFGRLLPTVCHGEPALLVFFAFSGAVVMSRPEVFTADFSVNG